MMTFKREERVLHKSGARGTVLTPAYEKVPYVQVDFGTHTGWCYPHELMPEAAEAETVLSLEGIPQFAKDVLYGYREGAKAAEAKQRRSGGMADVFTEAQAERRASLQRDVMDVIYAMPVVRTTSVLKSGADQVIGLVRQAYPDPTHPAFSLPENLPVELEDEPEDAPLLCHICGLHIYLTVGGRYRHKSVIDRKYDHDAVLRRPMPALGSVIMWGNRPWTQVAENSIFFSLPLANPKNTVGKNTTAHWDEMRGATYLYDAAEETP